MCIRDRLRGEQPENEVMRRGLRLHEALEGRVSSASMFDWEVDADYPAPDATEMPVRIAVGRHIVSGRMDAVRGRLIVEHKTTKTIKEPDEYFASIQWRCYLSMFPGATGAEYWIWKIGSASRNGPERWVVRDFTTYRFDRYRGIEADVFAEVHGFAETVAIFVRQGELKLRTDRRGLSRIDKRRRR